MIEYTPFFFGEPVQFLNICKVYPPMVEEVVFDEQLSAKFSFLTLSQEDIEDQLINADIDHFPTPLEFLLANCYNDEHVRQLVTDAFEYFVHDKVAFLYDLKSIFIGDLEAKIKEYDGKEDTFSIEDLNLLTEENFLAFQNLIRASYGAPAVEDPKLHANEDPRVRRIKAKARERERIKNKQKPPMTLQELLSSICCMGIGINPLNIRKLSYYSLIQLLHRYQAKEIYDIDLKSLLAGADAKKVKPKYWMVESD